MKILYVALSCSAPSGGMRIIYEHLSRLQTRGFNCTLVALDDSTNCSWFGPIEFRIIRRSLLEGIARGSDIVVATEANTMVPVMDLETTAHKFLFCQMRESLFFAQGNPTWAGQVEDTYRKAKGILRPIVISRWLKEFLENEYGYQNVPIVPNGVNTQMFFPDCAFPKPKNKKRVLIEGFPGNEAKDTEVMAYRATERYLAEHPGSIERWGFSQASCYGDFDRYWRFPNQDLIRQLYSSADILLKATRFEGRSAVDPEAMACGCAINRAITPGKGDDDLIDGYNCLKVEYGDFQSFYDNFVRLLEDDKLREELVKNGFQYISENLCWDDKIELLKEIYSS